MSKQQFRFKDNFFIITYKPKFTLMDEFHAKCISVDVKSESEHQIDIRKVCKKGLNTYFKIVFPSFYTHPHNKIQRDALFQQIGRLYENRDKVLLDKYIPLLNERMPITVSIKPPREYQIDTIINSIHRRFNLWALDMGLGKTITASMLTVITNCRRTVIICPSLVKYNWLEDMTKEWGMNPMFWTILDAKKSRTVKAFQEKFIVLNFEQVDKHMDYLLSSDIDHIIIDEVHRLKNVKSKRSIASQYLISKSPRARVTMLTGTPITNRVTDFFSYLKISGHPLGSNFEEYKRKYCETSGKGGKVIGAKNIDELRGLISNFMIRRLTESCLDLPKISINKYFFEFEDIDNHYFEELNKLRDLKEEYDKLHGAEKAKMAHKIKGNIHTLNRIVTTSKVPKIKELVDQLNEDGEKVVVFSGYKAPLDELERLFGNSCVKVDGSVDSRDRMTLINNFKNDPKKMVFLGNMKAAGIGVNLVNARHVIFMNFPFTPDEIEQAQKRLHRSGQTRNVFAYYTIAKGSIDEHIFNLVGGKARDISALIDADAPGVIQYENIQDALFNELLK